MLAPQSIMAVNSMDFESFSDEQRKHFVATLSRFAGLDEARVRFLEFRGSMVWARNKGVQYLAQSYYDASGLRKQRSLGVRSPETEALKAEYAKNRKNARDRYEEIQAALSVQARVNKSSGLGRMPSAVAAVLRALEDKKVLGSSIRVIGINALFAYEAKAGKIIDPNCEQGVVSESSRRLWLLSSDFWSEKSFVALMRSIDRTFEKGDRPYHVVSAKGLAVELLMPSVTSTKRRRDDWIDEVLGHTDIDRLEWLENAPSFEAMVIDQRGLPLRVVAVDPRIWIAHWVWNRRKGNAVGGSHLDMIVAALVEKSFPELIYTEEALPMLPLPLLKEAAGVTPFVDFTFDDLLEAGVFNFRDELG